MAKRKSFSKNLIVKNYLYIFLLIGFLFLLLSFSYNRIKKLVTNPQMKKDEISVQQKQEKISVLDAIVHSKKLLSVTEDNYTNFIGEDAIYVSIGINSSEIDLNYANIIITGRVELIGGKIISGVEKNDGNKQILEIEDPHDLQKYFVTLKYIKPPKETNVKTQLAIVVDDFGMRNNKVFDNFCSLNNNVTFAILPDQKFSKQVMNKAAETGHETMIHIPMEPISYPRNNPGPNAIYVHLSEKEIKRRMESYIKQFPLCVGANNHMGSFATTDEFVMRTVLQVLKEHELYFVDSRTSVSSIAYDVAREMMIPTCENKLFLDTPRISEKTLALKIKKLGHLAIDNKKILVITHCTSQKKYEFLKEFIEEIEKLDFELVPVSELFKSNLPEII